VRRFLPLLPLTILPAVLLRGSLVPGHVPGQSFGEGWGRLFAMGQVGRWLSGDAPPGRADLLAFPDGAPFWPIDPLTSGVAASLDLLLGGTPTAGAAALSLAVLLLVVTTGMAGWWLARRLGAGPWGACAAAAALQLHPFLLRSAGDGIVEVLALGPLLLLGVCAHALWHGGDRRWWAGAAAAMLATAACSPYFAVYGMILWLAIAPWAGWKGPGRRWLGLGAVLLAAAALAAAPLLWAEGGEGGRLDDRYRGGGYQQAPPGLVIADTEGRLRPAPRVPPGGGAGPTSHRAAKDRGGAEAPSRAVWLLHRFPGGLTCLLALGLGLAVRRARPLAVLAVIMFAAGAGPPLLEHALSPGPGAVTSPLQEALQLVPLGDRLGNAQRLVLLYALPALIAGAVAATRWPAALALVALALGEGLLITPGLRLASVDVNVDSEILAALEGPTVTFPVGDPPTWNPAAAPKRALYLASVHGQPVAGDYGRGRDPVDAGLLVDLSAQAGVPLSREAAKRALTDGLPAPVPSGMRSLLVLHETLDDAQLEALHRAATARWGPPAARSDWGAVYQLVSDGE